MSANKNEDMPTISKNEDMPSTKIMPTSYDAKKLYEPLQRKRKQDLGDIWYSKKLLMEKNKAEVESKEPQVAEPLVDPEQWTDTQVDIYDEAERIGMKSPLPQQYESFLKWLERKKKREIASYIDVSKFNDPDNKKIIIDLDDSDNDL